MITTTRPDQAHSGADDLNSAMLTVTVSRPRQVGLADWMSRLRNWLDHQGIELAAFKYHDGAWGTESYEVRFHDRHQADLFAAEFNKEAPSITTPDHRA